MAAPTTDNSANPDILQGGQGVGSPAGRSDHRGSASGAARSILRRRVLPGGRAVVGSFIVALAAVLTFYAYSRGAHTPSQQYVVALRDLAPGDRISATDVGLVALNLPDAGVRHQVFGSPSTVIGASVLAPISDGALIQASEIVGRGGAVGSREISLDIDRSRAVGGTLKPGEYVDVLGTFGQGSDSYTSVIVPHVEVLTVAADGGDLGGATTELIVFAVDDGVSAEALANAAIAAQITLIRAAEQPAGAPNTTVPTYHPPSGLGGP